MGQARRRRGRASLRLLLSRPGATGPGKAQAAPQLHISSFSVGKKIIYILMKNVLCFEAITVD